jgi:hypothetical protein
LEATRSKTKVVTGSWAAILRPFVRAVHLLGHTTGSERRSAVPKRLDAAAIVTRLFCGFFGQRCKNGDVLPHAGGKLCSMGYQETGRGTGEWIAQAFYGNNHLVVGVKAR